MRLIDADAFEKRLLFEFHRVENEYMSTGISLALGMLHEEPVIIYSNEEVKIDNESVSDGS